MRALWGVAAVAAIFAAGPARFVREKLAGVETPETEAVTVYAPARVLAVKTADVATPDEFVVAVSTPPAKVPLAPLLGAGKVTVVLLPALFAASLTMTSKPDVKTPL